jgi:hypothetical protein
VNFPHLKVPAYLFSAVLTAGALLGSASIALTQPAKPAQPGKPAGEQQQPQAPVTSPTPTQSGWQKFKSSDGRFSVAFPAAPTEQKSDGEGGLKGYLAESAQGFYIVMYGDSATAAEAKQITSVLPQEFVKGMKGRIIRQRNIFLQKNPGSEFLFEVTAEGEKVNGKGRIYQVGKRVYILVSAAPEQESGRFFNSFGLF